MHEHQPKPSRRGFFFGAVATGAAAAAVVALPAITGSGATDVALEQPKPAPEKGGGYSLSEHVKHCYKTARL